MNTLFEKSIRTLELPVVLEMLASLAVSEAAKEKCRQLLPVCDLEEAARLQEETQSARERLGLYGSPSFSGVKDVSRALNRADHGGVLNTRELLDVADLLTASRRVSEYDRDRQGEKTVLDHLFSALHTNKFLEDKIHGAILDEETIADSASPELADIRRKMRLAASKGRQILQRIISSPSYAKVLQEALITQRDGRFVVPVKAECKGSLPGLVHDISSSGATLFVEPMGVVQANNELKELQAREEKEIDRILRILSGECAAQMMNILYDYDILVHLDVIFARGQLSYRMNAAKPILARRGGIVLRRARHPLLDQAKAVPISLELGNSYDTLVITGPNTGGKTVTLKTIGLLTLMAQCGLQIPADDGCRLRVFARWRSAASSSRRMSAVRSVSLTNSSWTSAMSRASSRACPPSRRICPTPWKFCIRRTRTAFCSLTSWGRAPTRWRGRPWLLPSFKMGAARAPLLPPPPIMRR